MGIRLARAGHWIGKFRPGPMARHWGQVALDLLFPPRCVYCDAELEGAADGMLLCTRCRTTLAPADWSCCPRCGAGLSAQHPAAAECPRCRGVPLHFDTVLPLGPYRDVLQDAVLRMKHPVAEPLAVAMGRLYAQRHGDRVAALRPTAVVPIPMHWLRRLTRRTNSAEILASQLARAVGATPLLRGLQRRRNTVLQRSLPPQLRFPNVRGAFRVRPGYDFHGARVILVDDVLTTGATCDAAAAPLKQAGAELVAVAVLARAEGDS